MRNLLNRSWLVIAIIISGLGRLQGKHHDSGSIRKRSLTKAKGRRRAFNVPIGEEDGKVVMGEYNGTIDDLAADEVKTTDISQGPSNTFTSNPFLHTYERSSDAKGKGTRQSEKMAGKKGNSTRKRKEKTSEYKKPRDKSSFEDSDDPTSGDAKGDTSDYGSDSDGDPRDGTEDSSSKNSDGSDAAGNDTSANDTSDSDTSDSESLPGADDSSSSESVTTDTSFSPENGSDGSTSTAEGMGNKRAEVINEFTLEYQVPTGTDVPSRAHYEDLAYLTSWFLDELLYQQYVGSPDVTYIGANVNRLSTVTEFVLHLKTGTVFDSTGTVPSTDELDYVLDNLVCVRSGDPLKIYVSLLKEMESSNPFSNTTGVKCVVDATGGGQTTAATSMTSGTDKDLIAPIVGGVVGASALVLLALYLFTRHRKSKRQKVPVKEQNNEAEEGGDPVPIDASSLEGTATASLTSNPPPENTMYITSFQLESTQVDVHDREDSDPAGEDGENIAVVNEMRVLRDTDLSSIDDGGEDLSQDTSVDAQVASGED